MVHIDTQMYAFLFVQQEEVQKKYTGEYSYRDVQVEKKRAKKKMGIVHVSLLEETHALVT